MFKQSAYTDIVNKLAIKRQLGKFFTTLKRSRLCDVSFE